MHMCVCMCVCVCVCVWAHAYSCMCAYMYLFGKWNIAAKHMDPIHAVHARISVNIHVDNVLFMPVYAYVHNHILIRVYVITCTPGCMRMCMCVPCVSCECRRLCAYMYV